MKTLLIPVTLLLSLGSFAGATSSGIAADQILQHIKILASDDFEGRSPGTNGETKTVEYITAQFKKMGLQPGNPKGSFEESVPLLGITSKPTLSFKTKDQTLSLKFPEDFVGFSARPDAELKIKDADLVFVGYGVVAPEYAWDDYKGIDLHGKILVMLINDPAIPDPKNPGHLDPALFKGDEMTYYGRWTYKYEMAVKQGAAGAIIVHETIPAAYPFEVVKNSWARENFIIEGDIANKEYPPFASWITSDRAKELFKASGLDFEQLKQQALSKDFKPVTLSATANIEVQNTIEKVSSKNVIGKITGSDSKLKNEYVIYSAHWDHFGWDEKLPGPKSNQVFHGAADNASGVATLLEIANAFKKMKPAPKRTILFLATTAEERGLLGAMYYAQNPLYPLDKTLVDINIDVANLWGKTKDFRISGMGKSNVDDIVKAEAAKQGREVRGEAFPERGGFYRADHFEFAKVGVPVLYSKGGTDFIGKPEDYAKTKTDEYTAHDYHKVTDTVRTDWDLSGVAQDADLMLNIGMRIANDNEYPKWNSGAEFQRPDKH